jgi:hypothetical protein
MPFISGVHSSYRLMRVNSVQTLKVFAALALMFVLLMLTLYWMDQDRWLLAFASTSMLGFSVMAQLGVYGWLVYGARFSTEVYTRRCH